MIPASAAKIAAKHVRESGTMYPNYQSAKTRRPDRIDTILEWRYLAAHELAAEEKQERIIAEAAQYDLLVANGLIAGWRPVIDRTRRHVGAALIAIGSRLQHMSPADHRAPGTAGSGATS